MNGPPPTVAATPGRPVLDERTRYEPRGPMERFMVPLLAAEIDRLLGECREVLRPGAAVLDVGCGRQPLRSRIEALGCGYVSTDAAQNADRSVDHVCPIDGDLPAALVERGPFDLLLVTEVLEHVALWDEAFRNFARLTRPGSHLLATCPHFYPLHEEPYDFWRPTPHALRFFGARHGFEVVDIRAAGTPLDVIGTVAATSWFAPAARGVVAGLASKALNLLRRALFGLAASGWLRRRVASHGSGYLANVALLVRR